MIALQQLPVGKCCSGRDFVLLLLLRLSTSLGNADLRFTLCLALHLDLHVSSQTTSQRWAAQRRRNCADGPVGISASRLRLNAAMAATLESPMLMTLDAPEGRSAEDLCNSAVIAADECRSQHADILGVLLNRVSLPGLPS